METPTLHDYLYKTLTAQILTGKLRYGDRLPSWLQICRIYHVGIRTVKDTMRALQADGFIATEKRKNAIVIYRKGENADARNSAMLLSRKDSIVSTFEAMSLLLPGLLGRGARLCDSQCLKAFAKVAGKRGFQTVAQARDTARDAFDLILTGFHNPLLNELYVDLWSFTQIPLPDMPVPQFALLRDELAGLLEPLQGCLAQQDGDGTRALLTPFYRHARDTTAAYLERLSVQYQGVVPPPVSFHWESEKGRICRYIEISRSLMLRILDGTYPNGSFLPSIVSLAQAEQVSPVTARRAVTLLQGLGLARSINGKGTQVTFHPDCRPPLVLPDSILQQDMCVFLWALQLLALTGGDAAALAFPHMAADFPQQLSDSLRLGRCLGTLSLVFQGVTAAIANDTLRDIYGQLSHMLRRGRLLACAPHGLQLEAKLHEHCVLLLLGLHKNDRELFASAFAEFARYCFTAVRRLLLEQGVCAAETTVI